MKLIRGIHNLKPEHRHCVASIGNFDGVHLGHQAVIGQLAEKAVELGVSSTLITFEPQPQEFFNPQNAPARITRFREKFVALRRYAIDSMLALPFNKALADMTADDFIQKVLVDGLAIKYLVVGDDFKFGKARLGNFQTLVTAGEKFGFQVVKMQSFSIDEKRVSSTLIRQALALGDIGLANMYLGRNYRMSGRVAHGHKRGRTIGFPTANLYLHRKITPISGVFAIKMFGLEQEPINGIANLGTRPTVDGTRTLLEVHLFDFNETIYGHHVQIEFVKKIRDEVRFDSFDDLKLQIEKDVISAKQCF